MVPGSGVLGRELLSASSIALLDSADGWTWWRDETERCSWTVGGEADEVLGGVATRGEAVVSVESIESGARSWRGTACWS
jgi:hypothetical protein